MSADRDELAETLRKIETPTLSCDDDQSYWRAEADAVMRSAWLAEHDEAVRADERERVAVAILHSPTWQRPLSHGDSLPMISTSEAAKIARTTGGQSSVQIKRLDPYTIDVSGFEVRAGLDQEIRIRTMDDEARRNFLRVMGKIS